ncbi:MAG: glycosylhydrolase-like jelly roll fold domain-containing protein [Alistipes indistinctus]
MPYRVALRRYRRKPPPTDAPASRCPLEACGSVFVVFSPVPRPTSSNTTTLWPKLETALEVKGPWQVHFQEGRGAPAEATFPTLTDWSRHADPGIRYFSGIADYTTSFDLPESELSAHRNWYIDLGRTEVIARIELNGKPVTELWKTPFACDITLTCKRAKTH